MFLEMGTAGMTAAAEGSEILLQPVAGTIDVRLDPNLRLPRAVIMEWIRRATVAVTTYMGRYPVKHVVLSIKAGGDNPVNHGVTEAGSRITIRIGPMATAADLQNDWELTHEMFHLAFPTLPRRYLWMMEGLSDYLEPLARARTGQLTPQEVWKGFVEGLPQGLPEPGDRGLDNTPTWGRTYWGGNLYWLLADLRIRGDTRNQRSVDDAVRAILAAGGNGGANWSLRKVLAVGDKATGTQALTDLHDQFGPRPQYVDLEMLWKKLGVIYKHGRVEFDDSAPLAAIRISMTAPQSDEARKKR